MQIKNKLFRLKKVYIFFISYVLLIIFFSTTFLYANTFKVSDIELSEPFDLNFNKNKVIDTGFKTSFVNLISMITISSDKEKIKNTSLNQIKGMIDSFTISDEKFINDEYFSKLEVTFNKKNVLFFLEKKNIFPSIPVRNKVLLIPILIDLESGNILQYNKNIFYQKWNDKKQNYYLLDYLLPSEDIDDVNIIQNNYESLEDLDFLWLVKKYDLQDYIVIIIYKNKDQLKILSKINLNKSLKIDNKLYREINLDSEENFQEFLVKLKTTYENYWKLNNQINTSIKLPLTISVNSKNYLKINNLEKILTDLDLVANFHILTFDSENTYFRIIYNNSPNFFLNDMKKRNIDFDMDSNIWAVK